MCRVCALLICFLYCHRLSGLDTHSLLQFIVMRCDSILFCVCQVFRQLSPECLDSLLFRFLGSHSLDDPLDWLRHLIVWVLLREQIEGHSRIESEDLKLRIIGAHVAPLDGLIAIAYAVVFFENLDNLAPASPSIRRQILLPELIARR